MILIDFLVALLIGLIFTTLFALLFDNRGPWDIWWVFLLVILLGAWMGGNWITPFGPPLFGVSWLPFLLAGLFFALLLIAATPPAPRTRTNMTYAEAETRSTFAALNVFFWILILGMIAAIILAYI